ncbi:MAG: nucleotidyltransferase domain-containing protein [Coriobacteriales bacterium]|jgi:predicted nucleotidyltransferase|nr:nucleotidyltransferase domain-containing protein [Coriobacteriales bacterium]
MTQQSEKLMALVQTNRVGILELCDEYGVTNPRVFGSVVSGQAHDASDIDIIITDKERHSYFTLGRLASDLNDLLGTKVDLIIDDEVKPNIFAHMTKNMVSL